MYQHDEKTILKKMINWAKSKPDIRAVLLTSSRTKPDAHLDEFSDYDVIFVAKDIKPYLKDDTWLDVYGKVLVVYRDPVAVRFGYKKFIYCTQYEDGLKMDLTIWPVGLMKRMAGMKKLPPYIDDGYKVILDKDGITKGMKPPSCRAFMLKPPTQAEYLNFIEETLSDVPYGVKQICRGDFFPLQFTFYQLRYHNMSRLVEWKVEIEHDWALKSGPMGKGLQKYLEPGILEEIETTHAGYGKEANWESLLRLVSLIGKVGREVGQKMGYEYPEKLEKRIVSYVERAREEYNTPRKRRGWSVTRPSLGTDMLPDLVSRVKTSSNKKGRE
jgi:aminoglycoside 6-adenylyltransferase